MHKVMKSNWPRQPSAAPSRLNRWQESVYIPPYFQRLTASIKECEKCWAESWWEWQRDFRRQRFLASSFITSGEEEPDEQRNLQLCWSSQRGRVTSVLSSSSGAVVLPELCRRGEVDWTSARLVNVHLAETEIQMLPCSCCSLQMSHNSETQTPPSLPSIRHVTSFSCNTLA